MKYFFLIGFLLFNSCICLAQTDSVNKIIPVESTQLKPADTQKLPLKHRIPHQPINIPPADTLRKDTIAVVTTPLPPPGPRIDTSTYARYMNHAYLPMHQKAVYMIIKYRNRESKDELFYLLSGLVFFLAFIKVAFPRYFKNLFNSFFQTSLRLKQTKEQLLQDGLASLLSNLLFVISVSLYAALVIRYEQWAMASFWQLVLYGGLILTGVYLAKYLFLLFSGWVFNSKESAGGYIFIVFLVNKAIGILLIPFLLIVAFAAGPVAEVALTVSAGVVALLFLYRYIVSFTAIRNNLKVNALHFFLYLCAVEVLPLLLIYKVLINYIDGRF